MSACSPYKEKSFTFENSGADLSSSTAPLEPFNAYHRPWDDANSVLVIDAYQENAIDWNLMATDKKIVGVIHRSSLGLQADAQYARRRVIARQRDYLWGAYHLGRSGDAVQQADFFLQTVGNDPETLLVLDLEDTTSPEMMGIQGAIQFMNRIYDVSRRVPIIYANHAVTRTLNANLRKDPLFKKSRLWYARFREGISDFPEGIWSGYWLWQFSSELNCNSNYGCLYNVPGTRFDIDVNVFYGTRDQLKNQWRN